MTDEIKPVKTHDEWIAAFKAKPGDPKLRRKDHHFSPCRYGGPQVGEKYKPSLKDISTDMDIGDDKGNIHLVKIINGEVVFNGVIIATAPVYGTNGRKKTIAQQMTFCKAVLWSLRNDDRNLNEYALKYPSLLPAAVPTAAPEVDTQDYNNGVDLGRIFPSDITGCPNTEIVLSGKTLIPAIPADIQEMVIDAKVRHYDELDQEYQHETPEEIINAFMPVIIRQWSYKGIVIQEVPA